MNITKLARCRLRLTQEQFATRMDIPTQEQVSDWETGKTQVSSAYREKFAPLAAEELVRCLDSVIDREEAARMVLDALRD